MEVVQAGKVCLRPLGNITGADIGANVQTEIDRPFQKLVWKLAEDLRLKPGRVRKVQALTLDKNRPFSGLKGTAGLYGSPEWWDSIASGRIPTLNRIGTITRLVFAGQDARWGDEVNSFEMRLDNGEVILESIQARTKQDRHLFKLGARVLAVYALDELKMQPGPGGSVNRLTILLEMRVEPEQVS